MTTAEVLAECRRGEDWTLSADLCEVLEITRELYQDCVERAGTSSEACEKIWAEAEVEIKNRPLPRPILLRSGFENE
jgi:hypothetical protein